MLLLIEKHFINKAYSLKINSHNDLLLLKKLYDSQLQLILYCNTLQCAIFTKQYICAEVCSSPYRLGKDLIAYNDKI